MPPVDPYPLNQPQGWVEVGATCEIRVRMVGYRNEGMPGAFLPLQIWTKNAIVNACGGTGRTLETY